MFCSKCGNELPEGAKFCGKCGAQVKAKSPQANQAGYRPVTETYAGMQGQRTVAAAAGTAKKEAAKRLGQKACDAAKRLAQLVRQMSKDPSQQKKLWGAGAAVLCILAVIIILAVRRGSSGEDPFLDESRHLKTYEIVVTEEKKYTGRNGSGSRSGNSEAGKDTLYMAAYDLDGCLLSEYLGEYPAMGMNSGEIYPMACDAMPYNPNATSLGEVVRYSGLGSGEVFYEYDGSGALCEIQGEDSGYRIERDGGSLKYYDTENGLLTYEYDVNTATGLVSACNGIRLHF